MSYASHEMEGHWIAQIVPIPSTLIVVCCTLLSLCEITSCYRGCSSPYIPVSVLQQSIALKIPSIMVDISGVIRTTFPPETQSNLCIIFPRKAFRARNSRFLYLQALNFSGDAKSFWWRPKLWVVLWVLSIGRSQSGERDCMAEKVSASKHETSMSESNATRR